MNVLLVEDNDEDATRLIAAVGTVVAFERASSRSSAEDLLDGSRHYDVVVCDLRIPAQDDGIDRAPQHGLAVQAAAARSLPGTPTIFLTGVAEDNIDELGAATSAGAVTDVLGDGRPVPLVQLFRKDRVLACAQNIIDLAERVAKLDEIVIEGTPELVAQFDECERRAVCLAARQWNGTRATVRALGGGLSGGRTLHVIVSDGQHERASVFLKIDVARRCASERQRYNDFVAGKLSHDAFPYLAYFLDHLLGTKGCLVYKFADDWDGSLFSHLSRGTDEEESVLMVRALTARWEGMTERRRSTLGQLREAAIAKEDMEAVIRAHHSEPGSLTSRIADAEAQVVDLICYPQHGDLHGENVLCTPGGRPTLIDCGDIGSHLAGLDPVTLELSLVFHPESFLRAGEWPSLEAARSWLDIDAYVADCPHSDFVRGCRSWALDVAGESGLRAVAFLYLARQLKYADTPKPTLLALMRGVLQ